MSGPPRNEDKLNTIGIVVVGICGAVLVYSTIVALQAFYVNDTSEIQTMADYGGNETTVKAMRADQVRGISEYGANADGTYHMPIERGMQLVVDGVKNGDAAFVPAVGAANCRTSLPVPGRGHPDPTPGLSADGCPGAKAAAAPAPAAPAAPADGSGAAGSGAAAAPMTPTNGNATGGDAGSAAGTGSAGPAVTPVAPPAGKGPARGHAR